MPTALDGVIPTYRQWSTTRDRVMGQKLRAWREARMIGQATLGRIFQMSKSQYHYWETRGVPAHRQKMVNEVMRALEADLRALDRW